MGKKYLIDEETLQDQADTIKDKLGLSFTTKIAVADFATRIEEIPTVYDETDSGTYYHCETRGELLNIGTNFSDVANYFGCGDPADALRELDATGVYSRTSDGYWEHEDSLEDTIYVASGNGLTALEFTDNVATAYAYLDSEGKQYKLTITREEE